MLIKTKNVLDEIGKENASDEGSNHKDENDHAKLSKC